MANIINDLDQQLASLNQLRAPGASKGKIKSITDLCVINIKAESGIVQSLYRALKKAPGTHKLGTIYVIDSVARQWIAAAKQNKQDLHVEGRGEAGTYPAAVKRVTELMPALFEDLMQSIPSEQKDKLDGMLKIWEKGNVFPSKLLGEFRAKLSGQTNQVAVQMNGSLGTFSAPVPTRPLTTPTGYPPQHLYDRGLIAQKGGQPQLNGTAANAGQLHQQEPAPAQQAPQQQQPTAPAQDINSILAKLAEAQIPKLPAPQAQLQQQPAPQQTAQQQLPPNFAALFAPQNGAPAMPFQQQQAPSYPAPQAAPPFQMPPGFAPQFQMPQGFAPQPPPSVPQQYAQAPPPQHAPPPQQADPLGQLRGILSSNIINDQPMLIGALKLLQDLQQGGVPMTAWAEVLQAFENQYAGPAPAPQGYDAYGGGGEGRRRSRSPDRGGRRRASPVYGNYEDNQGRNHGGDDRGGRGGGRNRYRDRSPMRNSSPPPMQMRSPGDNTAYNGKPMQPKYIDHDGSLPSNHIKVLSRTLFVGGATGTQQEIQELFARYGRVQTCIANHDKRHAFVKMTSREYALNARSGMERLQAANDRETMAIARQTKWGVGFGPRECCDYQRGESIIPIHKLTDADMKWLLTAEYGGTGGKKVEGGMVLEEPDIEIGQGVSSKAMSRRVLPEGQQQGAQSEFGGGKRQRRDDNGGGGQQSNGGRKRQNDGAGFGGYGGGGGNGGNAQPMPMQMEAYGYMRPEPVAVATPPAVPGFGFGFTLPVAGQGGYWNQME